MALVGFADVPGCCVSHKCGNRSQVNVFILQKDGKAEPGTVPGDVFVYFCTPDPLDKGLVRDQVQKLGARQKY